MSGPRRLAMLVAVFLVVPALYGFGLPVQLPALTVATAWASPATATIHPGVEVVTNGAQCTANFVFTNGSDVLIGMAAHCAGTGAQNETNGCTTGSLPLQTRVTINGSHVGRLVYSSWLAMQNSGASANACAYNDFALVRIAAGDVGEVNPSVPVWGGPTGVGGATSAGDEVFSYQNSSLRFGLLSPKVGVSLGMQGNGWTHNVYTVTPGIPGDSGSGLLDSAGRAIGVLSTVAITPLPLANNFSNLASAMAYARSHGMGQLELVRGDASFNGALTGLLG